MDAIGKPETLASVRRDPARRRGHRFRWVPMRIRSLLVAALFWGAKSTLSRFHLWNCKPEPDDEDLTAAARSAKMKRQRWIRRAEDRIEKRERAGFAG